MTWAPVAQLDRASASGVEGHEFESRRVYHFFCLFRLRIPVLRLFCFLLQKAAKWCKSNKSFCFVLSPDWLQNREIRIQLFPFARRDAQSC